MPGRPEAGFGPTEYSDPDWRLGAVTERNRLWYGFSEVGQCQSHGTDRVDALPDVCGW